MESDTLARAFAGKTIVVTGHTGFKGAWLVTWLAKLGAHVIGYSLAPLHANGIFAAARVTELCEHVEGDIRDADQLTSLLATSNPDFIFHLAAQPLVRRSYADPRETIETNVLGAVNLLEAIRTKALRTNVVVVTSDKCYRTIGLRRGYLETDPLGGTDVYSMSKAAVELLVASYRSAFFQSDRIATHGVTLATARAGNVIGGGDWAQDRIVPDAIAAIAAGRPVQVRNPDAIRPWQHVLEPLAGYLTLAARMATGRPSDRLAYCDAWNFGPRGADAVTVRKLVEMIIAATGNGRWVRAGSTSEPREAETLRLDAGKARARLGWKPAWSLDEAIQRTIDWYDVQRSGATASTLRDLCNSQINAYIEAAP